jgi:hypothetical protein
VAVVDQGNGFAQDFHRTIESRDNLRLVRRNGGTRPASGSLAPPTWEN